MKHSRMSKLMYWNRLRLQIYLPVKEWKQVWHISRQRQIPISEMIGNLIKEHLLAETKGE